MEHVYIRPSTFLQDSKNKPWKTVAGNSFRRGREIVFTDRTCEYNAEKDVIYWLTKSNEYIEIKLDNVLEINTGLSETGKQQNITVALTSLIVAVAFAIYYASDPWEWETD